MPHELPCGFDLRRHIGEPECNRLMLDDRLAEALTLLRIGKRCFERGARHPDRLRRDADAARLEIGERDAIALAFAAEQIACRHAAVLEYDLRGVGGALAELILDARRNIARSVGVDDERRDTLFAGGSVRDREDDGHVGILAGCYELLDAIEDEIVSVG